MFPNKTRSAISQLQSTLQHEKAQMLDPHINSQPPTTLPAEHSVPPVPPVPPTAPPAEATAQLQAPLPLGSYFRSQPGNTTKKTASSTSGSESPQATHQTQVIPTLSHHTQVERAPQPVTTAPCTKKNSFLGRKPCGEDFRFRSTSRNNNIYNQTSPGRANQVKSTCLSPTASLPQSFPPQPSTNHHGSPGYLDNHLRPEEETQTLESPSSLDIDLSAGEKVQIPDNRPSGKGQVAEDRLAVTGTKECSAEKVNLLDTQLPEYIAHTPLSPAPPPTPPAPPTPAPSLGDRLRKLPRVLRNISVSPHMRWGTLPAHIGYPLRSQLKKDNNDESIH